MLNQSQYDFVFEPGDVASCIIGATALGTRIKDDDDYDILVISTTSKPSLINPQQSWVCAGTTENPRILIEVLRYSNQSVIDMLTTPQYFDLMMDPGCKVSLKHILVFLTHYKNTEWLDSHQQQVFESAITANKKSYFWHHVLYHLKMELEELVFSSINAFKTYQSCKNLLSYVPLVKNYCNHGTVNVTLQDIEIAKDFKRHVLSRYPYFIFDNTPLKIDKFYIEYIQNHIKPELYTVEPPDYIQLP